MSEQVRYLVELRPARKGERWIHYGSVCEWVDIEPSYRDLPVVVGESREDHPQPRQTRPESPESDETSQSGTPLPLIPLPAEQVADYGDQSKWVRMCETHADGGSITYKPYASWPAPLPGTHESDLNRSPRVWIPGQSLRQARLEYIAARAWSRANAPKAPQ